MRCSFGGGGGVDRSVALSKRLSSHFYVAVEDHQHGRLRWFQLMTVKDQRHVVVNPLRFSEVHMCIMVRSKEAVAVAAVFVVETKA